MPAPTSIEGYRASWVRSLRAENKSPRTIETYSLAVDQLDAWLALHDGPTEVAGIERQHIEGYLGHMLDTRSAATARQRYGSLRNFFRWLVEEDEIAASPLEKIRPPKVEERPPPVLSGEELSALLTMAGGRGFRDRRDRALLYLLADTGARASEIVGLTVDDLDLDDGIAFVRGKGGKFRPVPFGDRTAQALDRYLRARHSYPRRSLPPLWLGKRGPLTRSGLGQIVKRRGVEAGIEGLHPHVLRHTFVHRWLAAGGQEGDVARLLGWSRKSAASMLDRYGASAAGERSRSAHKRMGPVDSLG